MRSLYVSKNITIVNRCIAAEYHSTSILAHKLKIYILEEDVLGQTTSSLIEWQISFRTPFIICAPSPK